MTTFSSVGSIEEAWAQRQNMARDELRPVFERRQRAWKSVLVEGLPTTRHEEWKYTSLRPLLELGFDLKPAQNVAADVAVIRNLVKTKLCSGGLALVFVNGWYCKDLSDDQRLKTIGLNRLTDLEHSEDSAWWDHWQHSPGMKNLFAGLNAGFAQDGVLINLEKNQKIDRPLHIFHILTEGAASSACTTRLLLQIPDGAKLRVIEEFLSVDGVSKGWSNALTQFRLGAGADAGYYRIVTTAPCFHSGSVSVTLDRGSRLETCSLVAGSKFARINIDVQYMAPDAECILNGLALTRSSELVDHHTAVEHQVGFCRTHQLYKGILSDESRVVFNGKIFIRKDAQKSEAYQTTKNLLLSQRAEVDAKPQLEIDADDVKASHGAAIGSIDPAELLYLQSRCIGRSEAVAMLCRGFADDVVLRLSDEAAKLTVGQRVRQWFQTEVSRLEARV
jgi:Fe-S cluster assembly protein SufD